MFIPLLVRVALAASRLVLTCAQPGDIYIDGQRAGSAMAGQRVALSQLPAGTHKVELRDQTGVLIASGTLDLPEGAQVSVLADTSGLSVTSAQGRVLAGDSAGPGTTTAAQGPAPVQEQAPSSFDMNEGSPSVAHNSGSSTAGDYRAWSSTVQTGGEVLGTATSVANPLGSASGLASSAVSSAGSMVRNADAGGTDALRRSSSSGSFRQGRPIPPAAITGNVEFVSTAREPVVVYLDGFVIADLSQGRGSQTVKLEVGRHPIEIRDPATAAIIYKGMLQIDEGFTVKLEFSRASAPVATNRSWAWYGL